jgi:hypothetical protein
MKYKTKETAIANVKRLFANSPASNTITLQEAFAAWGRNPESKQTNMYWLYNILNQLKYHNLVTPVYAIINSKRVISKIQLTIEGKKALGRIESENKPTSNENILNAEIKEVENKHRIISLESIMKEIPRLKKENPEFEIIFDVKLRSM